MKLLRKPSQDTLIFVALMAALLVAAVFEHGKSDGLRFFGGVVYAGCFMALGFAAWRSLSQRRLRLTPVEWAAVVYAATFAMVSLAFGWPLGFLTALGLIIPFVVLSVFSVFSRLGWW